MELLNVLYEQYKFSKNQKSGGTHALFEKDSCLSVSQCVCEIVKLSGFERPQITKIEQRA